MTDSRIISASEVSDFGHCERLHFFKHRLRLRPTNKGAKDWGTLFHKGIDPYYNAMMLGGDKKDCEQASESALTQAIIEDFDLAAWALEAQDRIQMYSDHYYDHDRKNWNILYVEKSFKLPEIGYGFTPDLIVKERENKNKLLLIDFKTGHDFWSPKDFEVNVQLPKYLWGLRKVSEEFAGIDRYMISQIRTRDLKELRGPRDIFKRDIKEVTDAKMEHLVKWQLRAAMKIRELKELTAKEHKENAKPAHSFFTCKYCAFSKLCDAVTEEKDLRIEMQFGYERNTDPHHDIYSN